VDRFGAGDGKGRRHAVGQVDRDLHDMIECQLAGRSILLGMDRETLPLFGDQESSRSNLA
jgi:hypothetical protein